MIRYVLFDMDGVLLDSEDAIRTAVMMMLEEHGVTAQHQDFFPFIGMGEDRFIGGVAEKYGLSYTISMKDRSYKIYEQIAAEKIVLFSGITELVRELRQQGIKIAVASAADLTKVKINLACLGLSPKDFDAVVTGSDITHKKPDPEIFILAGKKIGAIADQTLVVEDAISGTQAGVAAGFRVVGVTSSFSAEELKAAGATWTVAQTTEIRGLLHL